MAGGGKDKLEWVKQDVPKFLRDFKAQVGYKEGPTVETKRHSAPRREDYDDDDVEKEDEKPTICVLKNGDVTEEEYNLLNNPPDDKTQDNVSVDKDCPNDSDNEDTATADGKIMFKKPSKRKIEQTNDLKTAKVKSKKEKKKNSCKPVNNKKLLSFADDEND